MSDKRCGTCSLWGENVGPLHRNVCCADIKMDLPASWSINNHMSFDAGADCPIWEEFEPVTKCHCGKPATTKYDGDDYCEPCARSSAQRDFEEADMPGGF